MRDRGNIEHRTSNFQHRELGAPLTPALSPPRGEGDGAFWASLSDAWICEGSGLGGGRLRTASPTGYGEFGRLPGEKGGWV